jgi:hypothetical protein
MPKSLKGYSKSADALAALGSCPYFISREVGKACKESWDGSTDPADLVWLAVKVAEGKEEEDLVLSAFLDLLQEDETVKGSSTLSSTVETMREHMRAPTAASLAVVSSKREDLVVSGLGVGPLLFATMAVTHVLHATHVSHDKRMDRYLRCVGELAALVSARTGVTNRDARATLVVPMRKALSFVTAAF